MKYELAFIINPIVPETEHQRLYQDIVGYLAANHAEVIGQPFFMGRKKLAYPIKKQKHGFYVFLEFNSENQAGLKDVDVKLKHHTGLLRHLIIKKDKATIGPLVDAASFNEKPAINEAKSNQRRAGSLTRKSTRFSSRVAKTASVDGSVKSSSPSRPVVSAKLGEGQAEAGKLVDLGEIDRKLDEILEQDPKID